MKKLILLLLILAISSANGVFAQLSSDNIEEASKLYSEGEFKSVIKLLKPAETLPTINTQAEMLIGDAYHKQEDFVDAVTHYDRAEEGGEKSFELYSHRARAYISIQEYKKASKDLDKAINMQPDNAQLYFFRAYSETEINHLNNAVADYSKAIELDENFQEAYYNRAAIKIELEQYDGVMDDLQKVQEMDPESDDVAYSLALFSYENENYEKAIKLFKKLVESTDDKEIKIDANYYIADSYDALKDTEKACMYFYKAMKMGDKDSEEIFESYCENNQIRTLFKPRKKLESVSF